MWRAVVFVALLAGSPLLSARTWRDDYQSRVEILALMQTLNADILAGTSATRSLEQWCRDHRMADDPRIVAHLIRGVEKAPTAEQLQRLRVTEPHEVKYRRVELRCGAHVLSEADNWYVPARLTAEMNRLLETTDTPFGKAVQSLQPYRRTLAVTMLWLPLPAGWEQRSRGGRPFRRGRLAIPDELFAHRAILYTSANEPFSEVVETYQGAILGFARP